MTSSLKTNVLVKWTVPRPLLPPSSWLTVQLMVWLLSSMAGLYLARELLDTVWLVLLHSA